MTQPVANLSISTNLWADLVDHVNIVCHALTNSILTAAANSAGAPTSGNVALTGIFGANVAAISTSIRGGTVDTSANLTISSNVNVTGANLSSSANVVFSGANTALIGTNFNVGAISSFTANVSVSGIATFTANTNPGSNGVLLGTSTRRWQISANNIDSISFSANSTTSNSFSVGNIADILTYSNANLLTAGGAKVIAQVPMATYRSAKFIISGTTPSGEYELSETNLIHNGTDPFFTTSVVYSNTQFFTVDSVTNGSNVDIRVTPTVANVSVKVLAQLIKG